MSSQNKPAAAASRTSQTSAAATITTTLALVAMAGLSPAHAAPNAAKQNVIMVLDSSGSMAGKINGSRKIDIARGTVKSIIGAMSANINLGLIAYGHRRKGDCGDIQTIHGLGSSDRRAMSRAIDRLRPVGKTPLSDAVRQAANQMKFTEEKATVILISDGKETCNADPCLLGNQLKARGIDFKVHVVGFKIRRGEEGGLQCLAKNTGGIYVSANNAGALKKALERTVIVTEASPEPVRSAPQKPKMIAAAAGLKIRAFAKAGIPQIKDRIAVAFFGKPEGLDGKRKRIAQMLNVNSGYIFKNLKPGEYQMRIWLWNSNHISQVRTIRYDGGAQTLDHSFNIGQIRFDTTYKAGGRPFERKMAWTVLEKQQNFEGKRRKIGNFLNVSTKKVFWLPAGSWRVNAWAWNSRHIRKILNVDIEAGGQHVKPVNLNVGLVRFDAKLGEEDGIFKGPLAWTIDAGQPDLSGKRQRIAQFLNVSAKKIFVLPAGEWQVNGSIWNSSHVRFKTRIKVAAGGQIPHEVIMNAARVRFDATVNGVKGKEPLAFAIYSQKKDLAGKQPKHAEFLNVRSGFINYLSAGTWQLRASHWNHRNIRADKPITIVAGQEQALPIELKAR